MMPQVIHDYLRQQENLLQTCLDSFIEIQKDAESGNHRMAQPQFLEAMAHAFNVHQNLVSILGVIHNSTPADLDFDEPDESIPA